MGHADEVWELIASDERETFWSIEEPGEEYRTTRDYTDLRVWQLAIDLSVDIYRQTTEFPANEQYGLTSQLRRASVSIASNIAEGNARNSTADYLRFLRIARGSLAEVHTQLLIAEQLGYFSMSTAASLLERVDSLMRQVTALHRAIERAAPPARSEP